MTTTMIYFGAQPQRGQIVSDSLKARGIELLKIEPAKVNFHGSATTVQPGFALYKTHLPLFIRLAMGDDVEDFTDPFGRIPLTLDSPLPIRLPDVIITWQVEIAEEVRAQLREAGFRDTVVKGRPAMVIPDPTPAKIKMALERRALETSPTTENTVNIFSFRRCLLVKSILTQFLRCHQYPAFLDDEHESEFNKEYEMVWTKILDDDIANAAGEMETDEDAEEVQTTPLKRRFKVSLKENPENYQIVRDEHAMPKNMGLLFPYVPELAKFDRSTVVEVIKRYFYCGLGDTAETCNDEFVDLVSAWGNIQNTEFGNVMAHIFKVVDIALTTQACPRPMFTVDQYDGVYMEGSAFSVTINDVVYRPSTREFITENIGNMDHHANALWAILSRIQFATDDDRKGYFLKTKRMVSLKALLDSLPLTGGTGVKDQILKSARALRFPGERSLDPTAFNIDLVLSYISDTSKDLATLPTFHHSLLFSNDRLELALGAFGDMAPSFRVPGGKEMNLNQPFRVTNAYVKKQQGPSAHRDVTKIGCCMEPLSVAIAHMRKVIELKTVLNPFGNAIVNASAHHMNKEFQGQSCDLLVNALRKVAAVTVVDAGSGGKKRPLDQEGEGSRKKGRVDFGF